MTTGWFFEEFSEGDGFETLGRTITEADIVNFMGISGIFEELYQDKRYAMTRSIFRGRVVPGPCTFVIAEGLVVQTGVFHDTGMALLGVDQLRYRAPVYADNTIMVKVICKNKRVSESNPDRGIIAFDHTIVNQDDKTVATLTKTRMIRRRPDS